jgi:hypothetical protein
MSAYAQCAFLLLLQTGSINQTGLDRAPPPTHFLQNFALRVGVLELYDYFLFSRASR